MSNVPAQFDHKDVRLLLAAREIAAICAAGATEIDLSGTYPTKEMAHIAGSGLLSAPLRASSGGAGWGSNPGHM